MDHDSNAVKYYIDREVRCDTQAAYLGRPSNEMIQKMARLMSLNVDPSAPTKPSIKQTRKLANDPEIGRLRDRCRSLTAEINAQYGPIKNARGTDIYNKKKAADAALNSARAKWRDHAVRRARKKHFRNADTQELERQFAEHAHPVSPLRNGVTSNARPVEYEVKQRGLVAELTCQPSNHLTDQEKLDRRIRAIEARAALCDRKESARRGWLAFRPKPNNVQDAPKANKEPYSLVCRPTQCIFCIGDESKSYESRAFAFCNVNRMRDHVEREHLRPDASFQSVFCRHPICKSVSFELPHVQAFKNHVQRVHGIALRA